MSNTVQDKIITAESWENPSVACSTIPYIGATLHTFFREYTEKRSAKVLFSREEVHDPDGTPHPGRPIDHISLPGYSTPHVPTQT